MEALSSAHPQLGFSDKIQSLKQELQYMLQFMRQGYEDSQRDRIYKDMMSKAYCIESDLKHAIKIGESSFHAGLAKLISNVDCSASSLIAMLSECPGNDFESRKQHRVRVSQVFAAVFLSGGWKEHDSRLWLSYLLSEETATDDACTIVSAIMLSAYRNFCIEKFKVLAYVYLTSNKEQLRQRALVGWAMCSLNSEYEREDHRLFFLLEQQKIMEQLAEDERTADELLGMLMQMILCINSEKESQKVEKELMPKISKGQGIMLRNGKLEMDEPTDIDSIINPGKSEKEMEEMEESIRKVQNMHKQGIDLYFKGFSQMKRFPFFYKIDNWFTPFSTKHPDISPVIDKMSEMKFVQRVVNDGPFCDSDKYSFVFALSHIVDQLPDNVRKMMNEGELAPIGTLPEGDDRRNSSAFILRSYLQDLYRFFRLFPAYKFDSIFESQLDRTEQLLCMLGESADKKLLEYASFLMRRGEHRRVSGILGRVKERNTVEWMQLYCAQLMHDGEIEMAFCHYKDALKIIAPDNKRLLLGYAKSAMATGRYVEAAAAYDHLRGEDESNLTYALNYVIAEANSGRAAEILNEAYRLDFEHEDNVNVKRVLGWVLLKAGRAHQADKILSAITDEPSDYLNASYAKWMLNNYDSAVALMRTFMDKSCDEGGTAESRFSVLSDNLFRDAVILNSALINKSTILPMLDMVMSL